MMTDIAAGSAVYVDSNLVIYFLEKVPVFFERSQAAFSALAQREAQILTSELTLAECLYLPCRGGHAGLVAVYEKFFSTAGDIRLLALNGGVAKRAAQNGGGWGLKLLDAIHYVSALDAGCDVFLTADQKFKSTSQMRVVHI